MMASVAATISCNPVELAGVVSTIGNEEFGSRLLDFVHGICGAEFCTVLHLNGDGVRKVTTASLDGTDIGHRQLALYFENERWKRDPMMAQARKQLDVQPASLVHTAVKELPAVDYRDVLYGRTDICDRVLLCGRSATGIIALVLLRTSKAGSFPDTDIVHVHEACPVLMAVVGSHIGLIRQRLDLSLALRSLDQITACVATAPALLSRREAEVCARVLYGMSSVGIALDLGISEETVMTYRKRAYARLHLASQRELLLWYLDLWSVRNLGGSHRIQ